MAFNLTNQNLFGNPKEKIFGAHEIFDGSSRLWRINREMIYNNKNKHKTNISKIKLSIRDYKK